MTIDGLHAFVRLLAEPEITALALEDLLARPGGADPEVRRSIQAWLRIVRPVPPAARTIEPSPSSTAPMRSEGRAEGRDDGPDDEPWDDDVLDDEPWEEESPFDLDSPFGAHHERERRHGVAKGAP